jgi:hypothetical protein
MAAAVATLVAVLSIVASLVFPATMIDATPSPK